MQQQQQVVVVVPRIIVPLWMDGGMTTGRMFTSFSTINNTNSNNSHIPLFLLELTLVVLEVEVEGVEAAMEVGW